MSRWSDQFKDNAIHQTLKQLSEWLEVEATGIDANHEVEKRRLKKSLLTINEIVSGLDPEYFPEQLLTQLSTHLRQTPLWRNLETYTTSPTVQYLLEANDHLTSIAPLVFQLAALSRQPKSRDVIKSIEEAHDDFCATLERRDNEFKGRLGESHERLTELDQHATILSEAQKTLQQNTETALTGWQADYTEAQTKRAEEYSKAQIDRGNMFDEAVREWRGKS